MINDGSIASSDKAHTPPIIHSATSTVANVTTTEDEVPDLPQQRAKPKRSMFRRMDSSLARASGNNKNVMERTRSRRMAQVHQDVKIIEITRQTRSSAGEKKHVPNKGEIFKFDCEGDIVLPLTGTKKHVKWHATFDRPIEQLIYPSLQRFDNDTYEEKRKVFKQLHGGSLEPTIAKPATHGIPPTSPNSNPANHLGSPTNTSGPRSPKTNQEAPVYSFAENHGIKIDLLPEASKISSDIMFIHAPKWTVEVADPKPNPKDDPHLTHHSSHRNSYQSNGNNSNADKQQKSQLKKLLKLQRKHAKQKKKQSALNRLLSKDDYNEEDEIKSYDSYDTDDYDDDDEEDDATASTNNLSPKSKKGSVAVSTPYASFLEEIDVEGEKYLREQIKVHYQNKLEEDRLAAKEQMDANSPFHELKMSLMKKEKGLPQMTTTAADQLYAQLVDRHNPNRVSTPSSSVTPAAKLAKLSELTNEEIAFNEQKKIVKKLIPPENEYLLGGVLYYRIQNQLHNTQLKELQANEQRKMVVQQKKMSRRYSNHFSQRLSARKSDVQNTLSEMHLARLDDPHLVKATDLQYLENIQDLQFHKLNRAVENKFHGFTDAKQQSHFKTSLQSASEALLSSSISHANATEKKGSFLSKFANHTSDPHARSLAKETELLIHAETNKRKAQDLLLLNQLEAGVLPETFIKPSEDPRFVVINLSQYGIGDTRGLCLGKCLKALDRLQSIGLTDNRLTATSLPTIISNLHYPTVMDVDLSFNLVHDSGAKALANHFRYTGNVLRYLDLCNCQLTSVDINILCEVLKVYPNQLDEFYLAGNQITEDGASDLCAYLSSRTCVLTILDLSWNRIGEQGAIEFSTAMTKNRSLVKLNLASNGMNDKGGQKFIDSIEFHPTIEDINLAQNGLSNGTCFVVSQVLKGHRSMKRLDLSLNPLGEAGARSIFRTILRGLTCFVTMRNCSYPDNPSIFNHTYPMMDNPYVMDLSEPYKRAVVAELILKYQTDPQHCHFEQMYYREHPKASEIAINLVIHNQQAVLKTSHEKWIIPRQGTLRFVFQQEIFVPTVDHRIEDRSLETLALIVENGVTEQDKKMWLALICQDVFLTTLQGQAMIDRFKRKRTIGSGGLTVLDILKSIWKYLLDTENMFDFLYANTDSNERRDLVYAITIKQYKFNWANPTSHWSLNLADKVQRAIMMQIIAINNSESEYSQRYSGRGDTSQQGNWFNFRNCKYTNNRQTTEMTIDKDFLSSLPHVGTIDFDYVSTKRPPAELYIASNKKRRAMASAQKTSSGGVMTPTAATTTAAATANPRGGVDLSLDIQNDDHGGEGGLDSSRAISARGGGGLGTGGTHLGTFSSDTIGLGGGGGDGERGDFDMELDLSNSFKRPMSGTIGSGRAGLAISGGTTIGGGGGAGVTNLNKPSRPVSSTLHTPLPRSASGSAPNSSRLPFAPALVPRKIGMITDDELYIFMQQLGLSNRSKVTGQSALFVLMDLQLASTKYYFTVANVMLILDAFQDDWDVQSRVIVCLFSRIKDLHNLDMLLRNLDQRAQQDIIKRLGYLNVINPLKISFDYVLSLKYCDNRIILIALMELAAIESADQIAEEPTTELPIASLYGSYTRALNDVRPEVMRFSYADFGVRTNNISWSTRREYIKKFLVGTSPIDEEMFSVISQFKELEANNALTRGPIDLQYANYMKTMKSNSTRVVKQNKTLQNAMRNFAKELKK